MGNSAIATYVSEDTLLIGSQRETIHWLSIGHARPLREQSILAIHGAVAVRFALQHVLFAHLDVAPQTLVVNGNYLIVGGERQTCMSDRVAIRVYKQISTRRYRRTHPLA